jgi:hypothetical protein
VTSGSHEYQGVAGDAIIDSGTNFILAPTEVVAGIYQRLVDTAAITQTDEPDSDHPGRYLFPCNSDFGVRSQGRIAFTINGKRYVIEKEDFMTQLPNSNICRGVLRGVEG